jgi:hypothetical protein
MPEKIPPAGFNQAGFQLAAAARLAHVKKNAGRTRDKGIPQKVHE